MCDRILVFSSNPGRVAQRDRGAVPASAQPPRPGVPPDGGRHLRADDPPRAGAGAGRAGAGPDAGFATPLHQVSTNLLAGLMETLAGAALRRPGRPAGAGRVAAVRGGRIAAAGRDAADAAFRRAGGRRPPADRRRARSSSMPTPTTARTFSPRRCAPMCRWPRRSATCWTSAGTTAPPRCASATSWKTTCRPNTPRRRCARSIAWGRYAELFSYRRGSRSSSAWRTSSRRRRSPCRTWRPCFRRGKVTVARRGPPAGTGSAHPAICTGPPRCYRGRPIEW